MTVIEGVDFANERPSGAALVKAGKHFVVRYLSPNTDHNPGKLCTLAEVEEYRGAGLDMGFVWETTTDRATQGFNSGVADAKAAQRVLLSRGAPSSTPIYFVAQDKGGITGAQVSQYFKGIVTVIPLARIGAYGGIDIIKYLFNKHLISWGWQTYAWSAGKWEPRAQLQQYHNGVTVAGVTVDLTRATVPNWGQWKAPAPAPQPPAEGDDEMSDAQVQDILTAIAAVPERIAHGGAQYDPDTNGVYQHSMSAVIDGLQDDLVTVQNQVASLGTMMSNMTSAIVSAVNSAVANALAAAAPAPAPAPALPDPIDVAKAFESDVLPNLSITLTKPAAAS